MNDRSPQSNYGGLCHLPPTHQCWRGMKKDDDEFTTQRRTIGAPSHQYGGKRRCPDRPRIRYVTFYTIRCHLLHKAVVSASFSPDLSGLSESFICQKRRSISCETYLADRNRHSIPSQFLSALHPKPIFVGTLLAPQDRVVHPQPSSSSSQY